MKPIEYVPSIAALALTSGLANRDGALPLLLQARALFLQEDVGQQGQRPEAHDGDCAHQLIVIQPQFLFAIAEEDFDVPARSDMGEQGLSVALQITGGPEACLGERGIQRVAHDHHLAAVELANRGGDDMHIHRLAAPRPLHLHIVVFAQPSHIVAELLPAPAPLNRLIGHAQPAIALEAGGDEKAALARRTPQAFSAIPAIEQHMRHRALHWLEATNERFHLVNLTLEDHLYCFAGRFLSRQLRSQRTTSREQHVEAQHQAMTCDALVLGGRVVFAQSFHLAAFWLGHRRVISNYIPGHQGLLGTTSPLGPLVLLTVSLGFDHELHLLAEVPQPACYQLLLRPRGLRQKPTQPGQTRMLTHLSQPSRQRSSSLTQHQPKPHGHEVLVLGLGELVAEPLGKVAQLVIQAYNRDWHRTPPWFQASFFFLIPHGVLSCYPLFKSANIEYMLFSLGST